MRDKKRKNIELEIESIGYEGVGIARKDGMVYMIKNVVPGDIVSAYVKKKRKSYREAGLLEVLQKSKNRIEPLCFYFEDCGGCSWQNLPYKQQLEWKKKHVEDAFKRIGHFDIEVNNIMPAPKEFYYRNKMDFTFSSNRWLLKSEIAEDEEIVNKNFALGLHSPGRYDKVIDIKECHIHDSKNNDVLNLARKLAFEYDVSAYNTIDNTGFLRNLMMRKSNSKNSYLFELTTNKVVNQSEEDYIKYLAKSIGNIIDNFTFVHTINSTKSPVMREEVNILIGEGFIIEDILGIEFKISYESFFQTNSFQLDNFITAIIESVQVSNNDIVWDLYCGTGSISLPLSKKVKKVYGIELIEKSIEDAKNNAEQNNIYNTDFYAADLHKTDIPELLNSLEKPDIIFIDPPRAGMHKNLIEHLKEIRPKQIVYVSCNPVTQARDCDLLRDIYDVKSVVGVDMFPQTYHIESIAVLELI